MGVPLFGHVRADPVVRPADDAERDAFRFGVVLPIRLRLFADRIDVDTKKRIVARQPPGVVSPGGARPSVRPFRPIAFLELRFHGHTRIL